jgi:hypothetical protein
MPLTVNDAVGIGVAEARAEPDMAILVEIQREDAAEDAQLRGNPRPEVIEIRLLRVDTRHVKKDVVECLC